MDISKRELASLEDTFKSKTKYKVLQGALRKNEIVNVSVNQNSLSNMPFKFNYDLPEQVSATNQKSSGRCWLFAGLNIIRHKLIGRYKLGGDFELSQAYLSRFDKIEKCNATLELIYELAKHGKTNQSIEYLGLITGTLSDGGTWPMFVNLVRKYGVVPKDVFPDSYSASNTSKMNTLLNITVKKASNVIHEKMTIDEFNAYKKAVMQECFRIVSLCTGNTVNKFVWTFKDTRAEREFTPTSFYKTIVKPIVDVSKFVSISHFPPEKYNQVLAVEYIHNVLEPNDDIKRKITNTYVNIDMHVFKNAVFKSIQKGLGVWFACDVGHFLINNGTVLDQGASNLRDMFDIDFDIPKKASLEARTSEPTHAMMLAGCQKNNDGFNRWKVENSHGTYGDLGGYITMSDAWFDQYVICAAVPLDCLPTKLRKLAKNREGVKWLPFYSVLGTFANS